MGLDGNTAPPVLISGISLARAINTRWKIRVSVIYPLWRQQFVLSTAKCPRADGRHLLPDRAPLPLVRFRRVINRVFDRAAVAGCMHKIKLRYRGQRFLLLLPVSPARRAGGNR